MIQSLIKSVTLVIVTILLIGSLLPFSASAASITTPTTDKSATPLPKQLTSGGYWSCSNFAPPGWVKTQAAYVCPVTNGVKLGYYIEPFDPNRSYYWICPSSWMPDGWAKIEARRGPCAEFTAFHIKRLNSGESLWVCEIGPPYIPEWVATKSESIRDGCLYPYQGFYLEYFNGQSRWVCKGSWMPNNWVATRARTDKKGPCRFHDEWYIEPLP